MKNRFTSNRNFDSTEVLVGCITAIILGLIVMFLGPAIACWLWGTIIVPIFGAPILTYWQMFGVMILARIVLGTGGINYSSSSK